MDLAHTCESMYPMNLLSATRKWGKYGQFKYILNPIREEKNRPHKIKNIIILRDYKKLLIMLSKTKNIATTIKKRINLKKKTSIFFLDIKSLIILSI